MPNVVGGQVAAKNEPGLANIFIIYMEERYFNFHFFNIEAKWKEKSRSKGLISQQGTKLGTS